MRRVLHIAAREWREQLRQPAMLGVIAALYLCIGAIACGALLLLQAISEDPAAIGGLSLWIPDGGVGGEAALRAFAGAVVSTFNWLVFTQFLGISAVLAGHTVLHDRQVHALPFLLLAPVRRTELIAGKVLGAMSLPFLLQLLVSGGASALAASLPVTAPWADRLPPEPAWFVAFFLGGPAWAAFTCTLCAIVSSRSRDVRTAQQGVWFVMFFATFACGLMLAALLPRGAGVQLAVAGFGAFAAATALAVGGQVITRDITR